jgi:uncharacterized protein (UPF0335 family)
MGKIFEEFGEDIRDTVEDILQELKDIGFETKAEYWIGGRMSYGKKAENIEISIRREKEYEAKDIKDVYERICRYLEQERFKKDLVARDGYVGSVPHLSLFEFMETWSSRFSFSRI